MRYASMVFAAAVSCLAGAAAHAPAEAAVVRFTFGPGVFGTFTTGVASPTDPGYDLIDALIFFKLSGLDEDDKAFVFTDASAVNLSQAAAFNPTTDAFINHFHGKTFDDIGTFEATSSKDSLTIDGQAFSQGSKDLAGTINGLILFRVSSPLVVSSPSGITPVPEPSTWAMMLLGFGGLGFLGYRQTRRASQRVPEGERA